MSFADTSWRRGFLIPWREFFVIAFAVAGAAAGLGWLIGAALGFAWGLAR